MNIDLSMLISKLKKKEINLLGFFFLEKKPSTIISPNTKNLIWNTIETQDKKEKVYPFFFLMVLYHLGLEVPYKYKSHV